MDPQTYSGLDHRLKKLELDVGDDNDVNLVLQVAEVQAKLNNFYQQHPELVVLDQFTREFGTLKKEIENLESLDHTNEEKQEIILIRYPEILSAYQNLMELLNMEVPHIPASACEKLDLEKVQAHREQLELLAANFHMLVVKNLIVLEKFIAMAEDETMFWKSVDKRLNKVGLQLRAIEKKKELDSKY